MMKVIARKGLSVPREDNARRYITDAQAVEVNDSAYYLRCLRSGDLLPVADGPMSPETPSAAALSVSRHKKES
ncbi:hypothetical protein D3C81_179080 [compost metagenome]